MSSQDGPRRLRWRDAIGTQDQLGDVLEAVWLPEGSAVEIVGTAFVDQRFMDHLCLGRA